MKNKNVRGILALALVTALSFGVIAGSKALSKNENTTTSATEEKVLEELDVSGAENIEKAVKTENGYVVTVKKKGYGGDIVMNVSFDADGKKVTKVEVTEQNETPNVGSRITEPEFLSQFEGVEAPVYLPGMNLGGEEESAADELEGAELQDGTYEAKADSADSSGFTDQVNHKVKWYRALLFGILVSAVIETSQLVFMRGLFEWDDMIHNGLGCMIGSMIINFFMKNKIRN